MKKMKIEKQLIFADQVKRIVSLNVTEQLTYRQESEGIRASGPLFIEGSYEGEAGIEKFRETLEMDVLAPHHKLNDQAFALTISDFQGKADGDSIHVMITLDIAGVCEDQPQSQPSPAIPIQPIEEPQTPPQPTAPPILDVQELTQRADQASETVTDQPTADQEIDGEAVETDNLDDLFQEAESTYTSYRIIVAKPDDSYAAIAQRYNVDVEALRSTNKNKEILAKTLVILPFA